MGRNLGPLNIKDSYEGLVQISGSSRDTLTDGSGSVITNLNVTSSFALTASFAENVVPTPTGSFMVTGSVTDATLTFTKGDASTFPLTVNNVANAVSSSHAVQADNALTATSASHALVADSALTATSSSHAVSSDTSISASHAVQADNALTAISASHAVFADTAGAATDVNALYTASVVDATISFLKGGGGTFPITINNVANAVSASHAVNADSSLTSISASHSVNSDTAISASHALNADNAISASYAPSEAPFPYTGSATILGTLDVNVSASLTDGYTITSGSLSGSLIDNLGQQTIVTGSAVKHIVNLSQTEYDALTPDVNTLYVISGSTAGGAAFPFTGSAEITGSLGLTGSLSQGETNSNLGTNTAILSSGDSLISASVSEAVIIASTGSYQSSTQPGRTAIIASDNSYINSTSAGNNDDIALIGTLNSRFTGAGARQAVIAGTNNCYNNGSRFSFIGGGENHIMSGAYGNAIVGGGSNRMLTGANSAMAGGGSNRIGNATQTDYGFIGGGSNNYLDGDNAAIIAGTSNNNDQLRAVILGGESNTINGGQGGIVAGGINNTVSHDRSVILGGSSLSTTKSDEVVVPSLDINGTVVQNVQALTITSNTASLDASTGQMFTLGLQNATDTHLELSNQVAGQTFSLKITNNATAAGTISFDNQFDFEDGTAFTATAATNAVDILTFTTFDGTSVQCVGSKNFS